MKYTKHVLLAGLILSCLGLWWALGPAPREWRRIPQIAPPSDGIDLQTYHNAVRIVEMAEGWSETYGQLQAFQDELAARQRTHDKEENSCC